MGTNELEGIELERIDVLDRTELAGAELTKTELAGAELIKTELAGTELMVGAIKVEDE